MVRSRLIAVSTLAFAILGCASQSQPPPPPARALCLPVVPYTKAQGAEAVQEKNSVVHHAMLDRFLKDYLALRDAARAACRG